MQTKNDLLEIIKTIVKELVDSPDEVKVNMTNGELHSVYEIKVNADDVGKVIGREGRNIKAVRQIANSIASKNRFFATVEILDV